MHEYSEVLYERPECAIHRSFGPLPLSEAGGRIVDKRISKDAYSTEYSREGGKNMAIAVAGLMSIV